MTDYKLGADVCDLYADREAEQRRQRIKEGFQLCAGLILFYGVVWALSEPVLNLIFGGPDL